MEERGTRNDDHPVTVGHLGVMVLPVRRGGSRAGVAVRTGADHAVAISLLSCATIRSADEEVNALIASPQRTSTSSLSPLGSRSRLTICSSCLSYVQKVQPANSAGGKVMKDGLID